MPATSHGHYEEYYELIPALPTPTMMSNASKITESTLQAHRLNLKRKRDDVDAVNEVDQFTENKIILNKQNAAWSGVEQPADLCRVFKGIKSEISSQSVKDIPADRCPMKKLMMGIFILTHHPL